MDNDNKYKDIAIRCLCEINPKEGNWSGTITPALVERMAKVIKQQIENYEPLIP